MSGEWPPPKVVQVHKIAGYHADKLLQDRINAFARKANEGEPTDDERAEYEGYAHANKFVAVLQAHARFPSRRLMDRKIRELAWVPPVARIKMMTVLQDMAGLTIKVVRVEE